MKTYFDRFKLAGWALFLALPCLAAQARADSALLELQGFAADSGIAGRPRLATQLSFKAAAALVPVPEPLKGAQSGTPGAYINSGRLYVKCASCPDFVQVASDVSSVKVANSIVAFTKADRLYVVTDLQTGAYTQVASDVTHFIIGKNGTLAFTKADRLYVVTDLQTGAYTQVASDVRNVLADEDGNIAFLRGTTLCAISDTTPAVYTTLATNVTQIELRAGVLWYLNAGIWLALHL